MRRVYSVLVLEELEVKAQPHDRNFGGRWKSFVTVLQGCEEDWEAQADEGDAHVVLCRTCSLPEMARNHAN